LFDFKAPTTIAMITIVLGAGAVALVLWLTGSPAGYIFYAPAHAFVSWALLREIDPDHNWTALVGAAGAGAWVLWGGLHISLLAVGVVMVAARIVTETTGRRPLPTDLGVMVGACLIGFTVAGWVAGFGLAIALYLDDRLAEQSRGIQIASSAVTAIGTTVVATLTDAFPATLPEIVPYVAITAGVIALLLVVREPADPITQVDARHKSFLHPERLHASRSLVGVLFFAMSLLLGVDAEGLTPVLFALTLALISNEVELVRRHRR
jgi:hypothetical protein